MYAYVKKVPCFSSTILFSFPNLIHRSSSITDILESIHIHNLIHRSISITDILESVYIHLEEDLASDLRSPTCRTARVPHRIRSTDERDRPFSRMSLMHLLVLMTIFHNHDFNNRSVFASASGIPALILTTALKFKERVPEFHLTISIPKHKFLRMDPLNKAPNKGSSLEHLSRQVLGP